MAELMDVMNRLTRDDSVKTMSRQLGTDDRTTQAAIMAGLPLLLSALARNASHPDGAQSLHRALNDDHDGRVLDDVPAFLGNAEAGPGAGILRHIFGDRQQATQNALGQATGMNAASVGKLLVMLAPLVLGMLGRAQRRTGVDANGLSQMIGTEQESVRQASPDLMGMATRLLDQDGDGSIVNELGGMMGKVFGNR